MKSILIALVLATVALVAMTATAAPYSIDYTYTGPTGLVSVGTTAVQPVNLHLFGVLPASTTATVARLHGDYTQTLAAVVVSGGVGTATLTNGIWVVPNDTVRITGATNATLEIQGNQ